MTVDLDRKTTAGHGTKLCTLTFALPDDAADAAAEASPPEAEAAAAAACELQYLWYSQPSQWWLSSKCRPVQAANLAGLLLSCCTR